MTPPTDDMRSMPPADVAALNRGGNADMREAFAAMRHRQDHLHARVVRAGFPRGMLPSALPRPADPGPTDPGPPPPEAFRSRRAHDAWQASRDAWKAATGEAPTTERSYPDLGGGPRGSRPTRQPSMTDLMRAARRGGWGD